MNKTQLASELADYSEGDWTKADAKAFLDAFEEVVTDLVRQGEPVVLTGFCKFERKDRKARKGRNPATGETIRIKAKRVVKVTPLKTFKDTVLNSKK